MSSIGLSEPVVKPAVGQATGGPAETVPRLMNRIVAGTQAATRQQQVSLREVVISMPGKVLKKQHRGKKKQHSRAFREEHWEFLETIRKDVEEGHQPAREFNSRVPDDDEAAGLALMFERSGLDPEAPGHWQSMLVAVVNAYGKNWTRIVTQWTSAREIKLVEDIIHQRQIYSPLTRIELCGELKKRLPNEYTASAAALNAKLQEILKRWRESPDAAPDALTKFEAVFGPARSSRRSLK